MKTVESSSIQNELPQGRKSKPASHVNKSEKQMGDTNLTEWITGQNLNAARSIRWNQFSTGAVNMVKQYEISQHTPLCQIYSTLVQRFGVGKAVWILRCKRTNRFFAQLNEEFNSERFELFSAGVLRKNQVEIEEPRFTEDRV